MRLGYVTDSPRIVGSEFGGIRGTQYSFRLTGMGNEYAIPFWELRGERSTRAIHAALGKIRGKPYLR